MAQDRKLTVEEYEALGEDPPGMRRELSDGLVIVSSSSTAVHNRVRRWLWTHLAMAAEPRGWGTVVSDIDVKVGPATVRRPDVVFFREQRMQGVDWEALPMLAPDLVIEIVSANDRADDLQLKVRQYLEAGAAAAWLLYPKLGIAHRYSPHALAPEARSAEAGDAFEEPNLLPGLSLPLREVFTARFR